MSRSQSRDGKYTTACTDLNSMQVRQRSCLCPAPKAVTVSIRRHARILIRCRCDRDPAYRVCPAPKAGGNTCDGKYTATCTGLNSMQVRQRSCLCPAPKAVTVSIRRHARILIRCRCDRDPAYVPLPKP